MVWEARCLIQRPKTHAQCAGKKVLRCSVESQRVLWSGKSATLTSELLQGPSSDSSNTEGSMVDKGSYLIGAEGGESHLGIQKALYLQVRAI